MRLYEAEITDKTLTQKIIKGELDYIKDYFEKNPKEIINKLPYDQDLVMFAVYADQKEIFDWLLANGAKAGADKKGFTPLHQAAINPNSYYVKELVKFGLDINRGNKKTPTPLVFACEFLYNLKNGVGGSKSKNEKLERANEILDTFKELIKQGADVTVSDTVGDNIFMQMVKHGITPFVKAMVEADKYLLKQKLAGYSPLTLAMNNFHYELVDYFWDMYDDIEFSDLKRFITSSSDIDLSMMMYNTLSDSLKKNILLEQMMYVQNGKDKMMELFKRGVNIYPSFVKNERIQAIAEELMKTNRQNELGELALEAGIEVFYPETIVELFLF